MGEENRSYRLPDNEKYWAGTASLGETIFRLVERRQTHEKPFLDLIKWFGRDKVKQLYIEERSKRSQIDGNRPRFIDTLGEKDE